VPGAVSIAGLPASGVGRDDRRADDFVETTLWEPSIWRSSDATATTAASGHDTLCDVFAALDPELFKSCFLAWINGLRDDDPDIIAVENLAAQSRRAEGPQPLHLVSAGRGNGSCSGSRRRGEVQITAIRCWSISTRRCPGRGCYGDWTDIAASTIGMAITHVAEEELAGCTCQVEQLFTHP
jgi:hypothetical protein